MPSYSRLLVETLIGGAWQGEQGRRAAVHKCRPLGMVNGFCMSNGEVLLDLFASEELELSCWSFIVARDPRTSFLVVEAPSRNRLPLVFSSQHKPPTPPWSLLCRAPFILPVKTSLMHCSKGLNCAVTCITFPYATTVTYSVIDW